MVDSSKPREPYRRQYYLYGGVLLIVRISPTKWQWCTIDGEYHDQVNEWTTAHDAWMASGLVGTPIDIEKIAASGERPTVKGEFDPRDN